MADTKPSNATLEESIRYIPNLAALHPDTEFLVYREYRQLTDTVKITVLYTEPGEERMRIDAVIESKTLLLDPEELDYRHVRIVRWGPAVRNRGEL